MQASLACRSGLPEWHRRKSWSRVPTSCTNRRTIWPNFLVGARNSYQLNNLATIQYERPLTLSWVTYRTTTSSTTKLTFNLGLRYELVTPELGAEQPTWRTSIRPATRWYRRQMVPLYNRSLINLDKKDAAPRFGFAYQVDPKDGHPQRLRDRVYALLPLWGESTLGYNGPYIVDATINQTPPTLVAGATQPLCTSLTANPSTCFRTTQSGYQTNFASAQNFSTLTTPDTSGYIPASGRLFLERTI